MSYITHYHQIKKITVRHMARDMAVNLLSLKVDSSQLAKQKRVLFTCFHSYFPDLEHNLRRQLEFLSQHFNFIPYSQGVEKILRGNIDGNYLCISADDGYKKFIDACHIFDDYGIKAMVFVNPEFIGEREFSKLEAYSQKRLSHPPIEFMNWYDVDTLLQNGHEVGNHTLNHMDLGKCKSEELPEQILKSYDILKQYVGPNLHFAWPYGLHENITNEALKLIYDSGHLSAACCMRGSHSEKLELNSITKAFLWRHQIEPFDPVTHLKYFLR